MTANVKSKHFRTVERVHPEVPDLHTQLEEILNSVWAGEANWRLDDRIDLATGLDHPRG